MSSMRIVLVDPLGEVLFSGQSLISGESANAQSADEALPETLPTPIAAAVAAIDDHDDPSDRCPETMRSAGSGVYRSVDVRLPKRNVG